VSVPTFPTAWERYRVVMLERGRRPTTITTNRAVLYDFCLDYLGNRRRRKRWDRPTDVDLRGFLSRPPRNGSRDRRMAANTRACYASIVCCFYRWCYEQRILPRNPLRGFVAPKAARPVARALDLADVERALVLAAERNDQRMTVMLWLMFGAGLRCMEVAGLQVQDLRLHADPAVLHVREGKGGKPRMVPLAPMVAAVLRRYLDGQPGTGPVVASKASGRPITAHTVSTRVSEHLRAAGVKDSGHALRHTFATELLKAGKGANLYAVSRALGHAHTDVTEHVYVSSYLGDLAGLAAALPDPRTGNGARPRAEPTGLAAMVPTHVRDQLAAAVQVLERHGPEVARAVETLGKATHRAWLATLGVERDEELADVDPRDPRFDHSDEEWAQLEEDLGIRKGWDLAYAFRDSVDE